MSRRPIAFIGAAAAQCAADGCRLLVLSPYASRAAYAREERLTPVLFWGSGIPAGLLLSQSTHRPGLVTNTDFAPSVAADFSIGRSGFRPLPFGFAWTVKSTPNGAETAAQISRDAVRQARGMTLLPYLALGLGVWILAATVIAGRLMTAGRLPLRLVTLAPLAALTAALFAVSAAAFWVLLTALLALALLLPRSVKANTAVTAWAAGTAVVICADMAWGNLLLPGRLLGYSAIEGARYYGVGNEAMGLLLGAALTAAARLRPLGKIAQAALSLLMAATVVLLGTAGAKAGGVLVSSAVFGTFLYTVSGRRWSGRAALLLASVVIFSIALAAGVDVLRPHTHSHIGDAVERIASGGASEAEDIVKRKLATEARLAYHSAWAALLWPGAACTAWLWKRTPQRGQAAAALRPAAAVGFLACLLLNDAGVVAAALFTAVLWCEAMTEKSLSASEKSEAERLP